MKRPKVHLIENLQKGEMVPLIKDSTAKIFFSRKENRKILEFLVANVFKLNPKDVKVTAYLPLSEPNEILIAKDREIDLLVTINNKFILIIEFNHFRYDILKLFKSLTLNQDLELKLNSDHQIKKDRNLGYLGDIYSNGELKEGDKDSELIPVYLLNLNTFPSKNNSKEILYSYNISDIKDNSNIYSNLIKIYELDVVMCYKRWYNNSYKGKDIFESNLIIFGAMLVTNKINEFNLLVSKLNIKKYLKENMRRSVLKMCQNDLLLRAYYDPKELKKQLERRSMALCKTLAREEERAQGIKEGKTQGIKEGKAQGIKEGIKETQKEMIINMYLENAKLDFISKVSKLSLDKVKKIINDYKSKKIK